MADFTFAAPDDASPFADMRGHHVAVRAADFEALKRWYVEALDFRVLAEWEYTGLKFAFIAPPNDDHFHIEILGGGYPPPRDVRSHTDLIGSLGYAGYHHFCLEVASVKLTVERLRERGVTIVSEPFVVEAIGLRLAFFADPFGNLIELVEVLA